MISPAPPAPQRWLHTPEPAHRLGWPRHTHQRRQYRAGAHERARRTRRPTLAAAAPAAGLRRAPTSERTDARRHHPPTFILYHHQRLPRHRLRRRPPRGQATRPPPASAQTHGASTVTSSTTTIVYRHRLRRRPTRGQATRPPPASALWRHHLRHSLMRRRRSHRGLELRAHGPHGRRHHARRRHPRRPHVRSAATRARGRRHHRDHARPNAPPRHGAAYRRRAHGQHPASSIPWLGRRGDRQRSKRRGAEPPPPRHLRAGSALPPQVARPPHTIKGGGANRRPATNSPRQHARRGRDSPLSRGLQTYTPKTRSVRAAGGGAGVFRSQEKSSVPVSLIHTCSRTVFKWESGGVTRKGGVIAQCSHCTRSEPPRCAPSHCTWLRLRTRRLPAPPRPRSRTLATRVQRRHPRARCR